MITLSGQLAIRTIHGRNGDFNVGRLATSIGEFVIKNAELDQYREGKYEGDFVITEIRPSTYNTSGRMVIEIRAHLGGMTLSTIDPLSSDEANRLSPQEVDPIDEEAQVSIQVHTNIGRERMVHCANGGNYLLLQQVRLRVTVGTVISRVLGR